MKSITKNEYDLFQRMLSNTAISTASLYLKHEKKVLVDILRSAADIENVVVVGAGPFIHLSAILEHQKNYIRIDPCSSTPTVSCNKIINFNSFFENIKRDQLPEGKLIFLFCFNVLFYLDQPEKHINRVLRKGDIVMISQWSDTDYAASLMKKYFHYVYKKEKVELYRIISNILHFKIHLSSLKLSRIEKTENEVNLITIGYFGQEGL